MTIIEAIKSGRRFRRKSWENKDFWVTKTGNGHLVNPQGRNEVLLDIDILADDWEPEPAEITITREKLAEAWDRAAYKGRPTTPTRFEDLCDELGL